MEQPSKRHHTMTTDDKRRAYNFLSGFRKIEALNSTAVVYTREMDNGDIHVMGFHGKRRKYDFFFRYPTQEKALAKVNSHFENVEASEAAKKTRRQEKSKIAHERPAIGTVLYTCWGYDQTNIDWYQITGYKGKTMVIVREIAEVRKATHDMQGNTAPIMDDFISEPRAYKWQGYCRIDRQHASVWDGGVKRFSTYA